jgi:flagellar biosynthesis protein FlhA
MRTLRRLLDEMTNLTDQTRSESNQRLLDDLVPDKVPMDLLLSVLRLLLEERVSIRNLSLILEAMSEARGAHATPESICEHVRHRLGFQLISEIKRPDGTLPLLQLAPEWEEKFTTYQIDGERGQSDVALPPTDFNRLAKSMAEKIAKAAESGVYPAIVTSTRRRRFLKTVLAAQGIQNPVFSFEEIGTEARPSLVGLVTV